MATTATNKAAERRATVARLKDYKVKNADQPFIGSLLWYSITGLVTSDELEAAFADCGLDPAYLPSKISPANAFKSACTAVTRSGLEYGLPDTAQRASLEIKLILTDEEQMVYHVLRNVTDGTRQKAHQDKVGEIRFNRGRRTQTGRVAGSESYQKIMRPGLPDLDKAQVQGLFERFDSAYAQLTTYRDSADIRTILRQYLSDSNAIAVKPQGAVYFVGTEHQDTMDRLERFVRILDDGNQFHQVPLVDTDGQRDMLGEAFCTQLIDEASSLIGKIRGYRDKVGRDPVDARRYAAFHADYEALLSRREEALTRLDRSDGKAAATLELLYAAINDLQKGMSARKSKSK